MEDILIFILSILVPDIQAYEMILLTVLVEQGYLWKITYVGQKYEMIFLKSIVGLLKRCMYVRTRNTYNVSFHCHCTLTTQVQWSRTIIVVVVAVVVVVVVVVVK